MSLDLLPQDWRAWLVEAVGKGCDPSQLDDILRTRGGFAASVVSQALVDAARATRPQAHSPPKIRQNPQPQARPTPAVQAPVAEDAVLLPCVFASGTEAKVGGRRITLRTSADRPLVRHLDNVLAPHECEALMALAATRMRESDVVEASTGKGVRHEARTGSLAHLPAGLDSVIGRVERRLAQIANWPLENFEHLQCVRYLPGQQYRPHFDWFDPAIAGSRPHLERGGQRVGTYVIFLNEPEAGGATVFPRAGGLRVHPRRGSAVWFRNVTADGAPDPDSLHGGDPVGAGEKWIITAWVRATRWRE
jgi:prolyl 4-hydroxylase